MSVLTATSSKKECLVICRASGLTLGSTTRVLRTRSLSSGGTWPRADSEIRLTCTQDRENTYVVHVYVYTRNSTTTQCLQKWQLRYTCICSLENYRNSRLSCAHVHVSVYTCTCTCTSLPECWVFASWLSDDKVHVPAPHLT